MSWKPTERPIPEQFVNDSWGRPFVGDGTWDPCDACRVRPKKKCNTEFRLYGWGGKELKVKKITLCATCLAKLATSEEGALSYLLSHYEIHRLAEVIGKQGE